MTTRQKRHLGFALLGAGAVGVLGMIVLRPGSVTAPPPSCDCTKPFSEFQKTFDPCYFYCAASGQIPHGPPPIGPGGICPDGTPYDAAQDFPGGACYTGSPVL